MKKIVVLIFCLFGSLQSHAASDAELDALQAVTELEMSIRATACFTLTRFALFGYDAKNDKEKLNKILDINKGHPLGYDSVLFGSKLKEASDEALQKRFEQCMASRSYFDK